MKMLKKYSVEVVSFTVVTVAYLFLRLVQILNVPMFTDEAIYTRWTQIALQDSTERFISLTDGKQPLFVWINMFFMRFIHDPLLSGRCVSVMAGFLTMLGLYFLTKELFKNRWMGIASMVLYVLYPFALVYDRMAIYDSLVGTFYIWGLYVSIVLFRKIRLDIAFMLGFIFGGAALNKIGIFSIYLLPFNTLLFNFRVKHRWNQLWKLFLLICIAIVIEEAMYAILRLSPWFYIINQKNATFFYPFSALLHMPVSFWINNFIGNFHGLVSWIVPYMTFPLVLLALFSFVFYKEYVKEKLLLFIYFIVPFVGFALIAKVMYPRYLFFMSLALLPLIGYSLIKLFEKIKNIYAFVLTTIVLMSLVLYADFYILTDFAQAPIPPADLGQFINDWPAGGGLHESVQFFTEQAKQQHIYVGTEGTFGLLPYGLEAYLINNPNITIQGFWPINSQPPQELLAASKKMPTYVVFYQPCPACAYSGSAPASWQLVLVKQYRRGVGKTYYSIYQVHP